MKIPETGQYENTPTGSHIARCYGLVDLGTQPHSFEGKTWTQRDVRISWELPNELMTGIYNPENKGRPFSAHATLRQSLNAQARLRKMLKGWTGRDLTADELKKFDLKSFIGKPCRLNLAESPDGQYTNVESISPLGKSETCPKQVNKTIYLSLEPGEFDKAALELLTDKTREKISASPEWLAVNDGTQPEPESEAGETGEPENESDDKMDAITAFWLRAKQTGCDNDQALKLVQMSKGDFAKAIKLLPTIDV